MGLKTKIRLLLDPEKRLEASIRQKRRKCNEQRDFPLTAPALLERIDAGKFEAIRSQHAIADPGIRIEKYLEIETWLTTNIRRVLNVGLDLQPPKRILDLGSGAGYFLFICKQLGHDVIGLDLYDPNAAWYGDLLALFGVARVIRQIDPFIPLPDLGAPFDYVCAFMVCFNRHLTEKIWKIDEWRFFLDDLQMHLNPGAVVWFELNPDPNGLHYTPELQAFFESRGAIVDGKRLVWGIEKAAYRVLLDTARREAASLRKALAAAPAGPPIS